MTHPTLQEHHTANLSISQSGIDVFKEGAGESGAVWDIRSFQIVSLLEMMKEYDYREFYSMLGVLSHAKNPAYSDKPVEEDDRDLLRLLRRELQSLGLAKSTTLALRMIGEFSGDAKLKKDFGLRIAILEERIHDELADRRFMYLSPDTASYYDDGPLFGDKVANKFGKTITDIQESGKCFATGRYTACVFHLMRVMEFAVQYLGKKLNINLVSEKNWANILDEVDKGIKALPAKKSHEKAKRNKLAESSAHLRMVKDAWRNDVMHPKETYTDEEAERIFRNVKDFMVHLATKL